MEPPVPRKTHLRPNAWVSASAAFVKAGPSGFVVHHGAEPSGVIFTSTPQGAWALKKSTRSFNVRSASMSGTVRMPILHQAESLMMFEGFLRELAWIAFTEIDGMRDI